MAVTWRTYVCRPDICETKCVSLIIHHITMNKHNGGTDLCVCGGGNSCVYLAHCICSYNLISKKSQRLWKNNQPVTVGMTCQCLTGKIKQLRGGLVTFSFGSFAITMVKVPLPKTKYAQPLACQSPGIKIANRSEGAGNKQQHFFSTCMLHHLFLTLD